MATSPSHATQLLRRLRAGDAAASDELLPLVYAELHALSEKLMRSERGNHTLQPTALVNEAWLRLVDSPGGPGEDRTHFLRIAARAMRNVLVDHARARRADKRGGDRRRVELDTIALWERSQVDVLSLHEALERLAAEDEQLAQIVELRFFGGRTLEETGAALGLTTRRTFLAWKLARAWLYRELRDAEDAP